MSDTGGTANSSTSSTPATWCRLAALVLTVAVLGLPVNRMDAYALLLVAAVVIFIGDVSTRPRAWIAAAVLAAIAIVGQVLLAPPRIEEGQNVFLPSTALERALPSDVYRQLAGEFDAQYPPAQRCDAKKFGCWRNNGFPDSAFAFSADSVWRKSTASRAVSELDFSDPVWLRLGFINERHYNWTANTDIERATRDKRFWMGLHRWHLTMPWYEMIRVPTDFAGGELCWRGEIMWESVDEHFTRWPNGGCRTIEPADAGRRIFGIAIKPDTLAMQLAPPWPVRMLQLGAGALAVAGVFAVVIALVRFRVRRTLLPFILIGLAITVIAVDDGSFLGGVRPFDGGDDGLFYDGVGRMILQKLMNGDIAGFLQGGENIFYYGGPGLRYFRALEHVVFGESYLGYLSLVLLLPFIVYKLFHRFLPEPWPLALVLLFIAVPVGAGFGTSYFNYVKWAARGFADPVAYILFLAGLLPIFGRSADGPSGRFLPAFFGALLLALGIFMKPIVAPAAAVVLGAAGLAALSYRQWPRLAGLCIGFLPVFSMALHNWVFGRVFVLFSSNSQDSNLLVMPPSAYAAALRELPSLNFSGLARMAKQLADWLSGPAESYWTIPVNGLAVAVLIYVVVRGRRFDPWLRVAGAAALAQHVVALFYDAATARYHFLDWFLTMLVVVVWFHQVGIDWLSRRFPVRSDRIAAHPLRILLASGLTRLQKSAA
jgi:hypothetical protein